MIITNLIKLCNLVSLRKRECVCVDVHSFDDPSLPGSGPELSLVCCPVHGPLYCIQHFDHVGFFHCPRTVELHTALWSWGVCSLSTDRWIAYSTLVMRGLFAVHRLSDCIQHFGHEGFVRFPRTCVLHTALWSCGFIRCPRTVVLHTALWSWAVCSLSTDCRIAYSTLVMILTKYFLHQLLLVSLLLSVFSIFLHPKKQFLSKALVFPCFLVFRHIGTFFPRSVLFCQPHQQLFT